MVHGVLCTLTSDDEKVLDKNEDVAKGDYIKMQCMVGTDQGSVQALTYVNKLTREGHPNPGYLEKIIEGAQSHGLPAEYVDEIRSWALRPTVPFRVHRRRRTTAEIKRDEDVASRAGWRAAGGIR